MRLARSVRMVALLGAGLASVAWAAAPAVPNVVRGEGLYNRCLACHALAYDRVGPRHCGLLGRRAGSVAGFDYSPAMKQSALVWDEKTLNLFLKKPLALVLGSSMTYDGVPDAADRTDLVAYLKAANQSTACGAKAK